MIQKALAWREQNRTHQNNYRPVWKKLLGNIIDATATYDKAVNNELNKVKSKAATVRQDDACIIPESLPQVTSLRVLGPTLHFQKVPASTKQK